MALVTVPARATDCAFEPQGEGHVTGVIDGRSFRLSDGREIKLAGIEPVASDTAKADRTTDLSAIIAGKDVSLRGEDDAPIVTADKARSSSLPAAKRRCKACC